MHQTRQEMTSRLPLPRKGTKYVARAASHHMDSVPVVIAIRDILKLATTAREVKEMLKQKLLKVNGKNVFDYHQSIKLFNTLEADKNYRLTLSPQGKFTFQEIGKSDVRICKVINKTLVKENKIQLNLHDGTNVLTKDAIAVGDSLYISNDGKIQKHVALAKGKSVLIISGKYAGTESTVSDVDGKKVKIKINGSEALLDNTRVIAL